MSLFLFGGQVLNGFSFALVVGIMVGTYSSIFIASPILVFWQNFLESRKLAGRRLRRRTHGSAEGSPQGHGKRSEHDGYVGGARLAWQRGERE